MGTSKIGTTREVRALAIAATTSLRRTGAGWRVPSQTGTGSYLVNDDSCNCPDHETRGVVCKHMLAVEFTIRRERGNDGAYKVTEEVKVTYSQDWTAYNTAQCEEKDRFAELLADLCDGISETYMDHYHKRSNVETVFHMMKSKFGDRVLSKGDLAQHNEVLCKVVAHNICVIIQATHELGIDAGFRGVVRTRGIADHIRPSSDSVGDTHRPAAVDPVLHEIPGCLCAGLSTCGFQVGPVVRGHVGAGADVL